MLGRPVFGSRTGICTIAAPALAASIAEDAICSGVTGTAGFLPGVSADPVTAHEIITLRCTAALPEFSARKSLQRSAGPDYGVVGVTSSRTLPLIVRCAKPNALQNESVRKNLPDSQRLEAYQDTAGGSFGQAGRRVADDRAIAGLFAARRVHCGGDRHWPVVARRAVRRRLPKPRPGETLRLRMRLQRIRRRPHEVRRSVLSGRDLVHH